MKNRMLERIEIMQGDITKLKVGAIVNAANNSLLGGGGVDGAIHRAAGHELLNECRTIGGCPTGEARITSGYKLYAEYVIHTVGPVYGRTSNDSRVLSLCYSNCLKLAVEYKIDSIAFPAVSCGVYGYPIQDASKIAIETTCNFIQENTSIGKVIFVLFSEKNYDVYKNCLSSFRSSAKN